MGAGPSGVCDLRRTGGPTSGDVRMRDGVMDVGHVEIVAPATRTGTPTTAAGPDLAAVRSIRDEIRGRVEALVTRLDITTDR